MPEAVDNRVGRTRMIEVLIKNMPDHLFEQLRERARLNRRSLNNELLVLLEQALKAEMNERYGTVELLEEARKLREHLGGKTSLHDRPLRAWGQR